MLPKNHLPKPAPSSSPVPGKPATARGTLQHLWANAPMPKPKPVLSPARKIPREFMTLKERDAADREDAATQPSIHEGDMGLDGAGDTKDDGVMRNARGEVMRNRHGTNRLASASLVKKKPLTFGKQMKKLAPLKEKDNKQSNMKNLVVKSEELAADEGQDSGREIPRKHGTPAPEAKLGRGGASKLAGPEESSSKTGRRSPHEHSGTPVPGSRAGTPRIRITVKNAMDSNQKLKRAGSNFTKDSRKTRRTISPERKVSFSTKPSTPERNVRLPNQDKTPVVEITAFDPDANFHKALTSPVKKAMKPFGNANSRSGTPSRQPHSPSISANIAATFQTPTKAGSRSTTPTPQWPLNATNTASAIKVKPAVQNVSPLKKVGKHARSLSEALESPKRGKRSRTGTPRTTPPKIVVEDDDSFLSELGATPSPVKKSSLLKMAAPPNNTTPSKKDKSSSFLSPLEDTPSPPPALETKPRLVNGSPPITNGRSSQSRRTVVEDTDAESSEDSDDDLPMAFHNPRAVASIPCIPAPVATTNRKGILPVPGKDRKYKFSLKNLVASMADNERTNEIAAKVAKMMAEKDALLKNPSKNASGTATPHDGHAKLLQDVVKQHSAEAGGNDAQKVLKALKRANVTQSDEMVYHFFESGEPKKMKNKREYPKYVLHLLDKEGPNKIWHEMFASRESREMGLRDGLYAEMVAVDKGMGEAMFYWVLDQLAKESNATLRNGYLAMLLNAPVSILGHFTPDTVRRHLKTLGARREALVTNKEMVLELEPVQESLCLGFTNGDHWGGLIDFLELLGRTAILLSFETREYALGVILRLCADKVIRAHISIEEGVQKALMLLSEAFETEEQWEMVSTRLSQTLYTTIPTTALLLRIFSSIPSRPRLHNFRRRLAYTYFLQNPSLLEEGIQSTFSIDNLTRHLETKKFMTSRDTKDSTYARLDSDIQLLDIALDSGSSSAAPRLGIRHLYYALLAAGADCEDVEPPKLSAVQKEKEKIFNEQCDTLAQRLNMILNGIQDLGPGHAERSACRATIGGVRNRVECCVRTFVRQKVRRIGGDGHEETEREVERREEVELGRGKKFLAGFLKRAEDTGEEGGSSVEAEAEMLLKRYS